MKLTRTSILYAILAVVLLSAVPASIQRIIETGDPYLFTKQFFHDLLARLTGPGKLRFIIQPIVAIFLGVRHGAKDANAQLPPFVSMLTFSALHRRHAFQTAVRDVRDLVAIAILLDIIAQALIFHHLYPGAAVIVGPILIAIPYSLARDLANRLVRVRRPRATAAGAV